MEITITTKLHLGYNYLFTISDVSLNIYSVHQARSFGIGNSNLQFLAYILNYCIILKNNLIPFNYIDRMKTRETIFSMIVIGTS